MGPLLVEALALSGQLLFRFTLLSETLPLFAGFLALLLDLHEEVSCELDLLESKRVVVGVHAHLHHRAELYDGGDGRLESILRRRDVAGAKASYEGIVPSGPTGARSGKSP